MTDLWAALIMPLATRLILIGFAFVALAGPASARAAWGETERIGDLGALTEHPGPDHPTGARVPAMPPEISSGNAAKLTKGSRPLPVRMDVDNEGNVYVLTQGPPVQIIGPPRVDGNVLRASDYPACSGYQGFGLAGHLYVASLVSVYRVDVQSRDITWLGTWLSQSEAGAPAAVRNGQDTSPLREGADPPAGLAIDRTPGSERLYVSVPGEGILRRDLGGPDAWQPPLVSDDHDVWLPYEADSAFGGDPQTPEAIGYPLGEGVLGLVPCLGTGLTAQQRVDSVYGTLWEGGPSVPSAIAVDPVTREVVVAEQSPEGTLGLEEQVDRIAHDALRLRRFSASGDRLADVSVAADEFDPTGSLYRPQAVYGSVLAPTLLGRGGIDQTFDSRVGGMAFDTGGELHVLNQSDDTFAQVFRAEREAAGGLKAAAVFRADSTRQFGQVSSPAPRGIEDLAVRPVGGGSDYRYLVSPTSGAGLLELKSDGAPNGTIGSALDPGDPGKACTFDNARIRLAVDPRDGSVIVLQQPVGDASPVILRLDPGASDANCATTTPPEEVEPTDPVLTVVGTPYKGDLAIEPVSGSEFVFTPTTEGETIEIDDEDASSGWLFSVRATDEDNGGADFDTTASCAVTVTVTSPVTSTLGLRAGECRPLADSAQIQGVPGSRSNGSPFTLTKAALRDAATGEGRTADVQVTITDDEGVTASTSFRVRLKTTVRASFEITRFDVTNVGANRPNTFRFNHTASGLEDWQLDFGGDDVTPSRLPADGWSSAVLSSQSPEVTFPGPGVYTATLRIRRGAGTEAEEVAEQQATVFISADTTRDPTIVPVQSGAACDTPLGTPLAQLGLGDPQLCVPADPCDVDTQALGLTRLPIVRPASCAGDDAGLFAASATTVAAALPQGSRPSVISSSLRLGRDRRISVRVRCGTGPTRCAGKLRIALAGGRSPRTIGSASFTGLRSQARRTVRLRVSAAMARRLRRGSSRKVNVTVTPRVPRGFVVPKTKAKRLRLGVSPPRRAR